MSIRAFIRDVEMIEGFDLSYNDSFLLYEAARIGDIESVIYLERLGVPIPIDICKAYTPEAYDYLYARHGATMERLLRGYVPEHRVRRDGELMMYDYDTMAVRGERDVRADLMNGLWNRFIDVEVYLPWIPARCLPKHIRARMRMMDYPTDVIIVLFF